MTSVKVTEREIYDKLLVIEKKLDKTNGKVSLNRWIATTALSLILLLIGIRLGGLL